MTETKSCNIYRVTDSGSEYGYDVYNGFVAYARSEAEARSLHPALRCYEDATEADNIKLWESECDEWAYTHIDSESEEWLHTRNKPSSDRSTHIDTERLVVELIGHANIDLDTLSWDKRIILADYHHG